LFHYNSDGGTLDTAKRPDTLPDVNNSRHIVPSSIAARGGRIVMTWMNWNLANTPSRPGKVQVMRGTVASDGALTWTAGGDFANTESGFGDVMLDPCVTHDGSQFL